MNKLFTMLAMAMVAGVMLWAGDACADTTTGSSAWNIALGKVLEAFQYSRKMIFIVGGFGLVTLAFFAIFGKIRWNWFAALCIGLGIVAIAGYIIEYVTEDSASKNTAMGASGEVGYTMGLTGTSTSGS